MPEHPTGKLFGMSRKALFGVALILALSFAIFIWLRIVRAEGLFQDLPDAERKVFQERAKAELAKSKLFTKSDGVLKEGVRSDAKKVDRKYVSENVIQPALAKRTPAPVEIKLFDDVSVRVVTEKVEPIKSRSKQEKSSERYSWVGHLEGDETSKAIFIVKDGTLRGVIHRRGKVYRIHPISQGTPSPGMAGEPQTTQPSGQVVHSISEVDDRIFPEETKPFTPKVEKKRQSGKPSTRQGSTSRTEKKRPQQGAPVIAADVSEESEAAGTDVSEGTALAAGIPCEVDVLVVYTTEAMNASDDIEEEIALAGLITNYTYIWSRVDKLKINIVGTKKINDPGTHDLSADVQELMDPNGRFAAIHQWREEFQADLVSLWEESGNACGAGTYLPPPMVPEYAANGFSIVNRACGVDYFSFAHELGHLMGAQHDRFSENAVGADRDHNYGHVHVKTKQRTIMAYNLECDAQTPSVYCERLPFWSNPDNEYTYADGKQMGVPVKDVSRNDADDRRTLNDSACAVSMFRPKAQVE